MLGTIWACNKPQHQLFLILWAALRCKIWYCYQSTYLKNINKKLPLLCIYHMLLPTYSLILIINNSTEKKLIFPFSDEETDIHTMLKWQLAFKHGSVSTVHALDSRNGWGSLSRKLTKLSLGLASLSSKAEEHTIVAQISFGSFIINREHSTAECANRAYHNRRLLRPAKEQDSRRSRLPQWQTRTLFTPALLPFPPKVDPWRLPFCRPSKKQNSTIIEGWHIHSLPN